MSASGPPLLVTDALDRLARRLLDLLAYARSPIACFVHDALAADFAGEDDLLRGGHRLASDACFRILRQEQVDDRVADLVGDLVWVTFGIRFGRKEVGIAHGNRSSLAEMC